ncbi:recombinase family protein [Leptolyngbya sp. FACHB-711]|uniref:recombinase family protein n=1 Tax=Leptolyngbya sp. FACHB-711 TaxID=2692813 RepID=UPI001686C86D|nr:recombinase family protein [Leptolyngbya sp. FACHB-711]MBD2023817.1 recombinase family protein [Leptolyngbya sp. FACHB-711]
MPRKVIGYARVNANAQSDLDEQMAQLEVAGATEVLADVQSGMSSDRAGLNRLMNLIATDQADMVLVTRVDRLSRSATQLLQFINLCRDKNVAIKVLEQNLSVL